MPPPLPITTGPKRQAAGVLLLTLLAALLLLPDHSAAEEAGENSAPVIANGVLTPGILPYEGGSVSIGADVTDDVGVSTVYAEVIGSDGTLFGVDMSPTGGTSYGVSIDVPANFSEAEVSYSVYVWASDADEAFASELIGDIQVPPPPQFDEAPIVGEPSVEPRQLPAAGGSVDIQVDASDNRSVSEVYATIALPGGGAAQVQLEPISASRFEGVFAAPPNAGAATQQYGVEVTALDDIGQPASVDGGSFSVAAAPAQSAGRLAIWPASRHFGSVKVGRRAWRFVWLRNAGPRSSKPVEGILRVAGEPFSLPGAGPDGVPFRLRPGEIRPFLVQFRPRTAGSQSGSLDVVRADGAQAGLAVQLGGRGLGRWR